MDPFAVRVAADERHRDHELAGGDGAIADSGQRGRLVGGRLRGQHVLAGDARLAEPLLETVAIIA